MANNVLDWLDHQTLTAPDQPYCSDDITILSFHDAWLESRRIGAGLISALDAGSDAQKLVIPSLSPILVFSGRHVHTISAFLGVVCSGHCYAPVDAALPEERIRSIIRTASPAAILSDREHLEQLKSFSVPCPIFCIQDLLSAEDTLPDKYAVQLNFIRDSMIETDPLYIIFTSGSTGTPKGVCTSHHALLNYIEAYEEVMRIESSDTLGCQSPLDYIAAIRDIYLPLLTGCSTYLIPKECFMEPDHLFEVMNQHHVTAVGWSVSALTIPVRLGALQDSQSDIKPLYLRKVCFSGSVMPSRILRIWQHALPAAHFVNQYGPTEATASCTCYSIDHLVSDDEILPIGWPYRNYRIYLIKDDNTLAEPGEEGEICVCGPGLALGYYGNPDRSARDFIQNPQNKNYRELLYKTGDYGIWKSLPGPSESTPPRMALYFLGRRDRQIKHMGHRVELDEIDRAAMQNNCIQECCTVYNKELEQIWLFYSGTADKRTVAVELRRFLPGFMIPRKIQKLEELPKLPNGKIDMTVLKRLTNLPAKGSISKH